ncbi:MAG: hypothetical protein AVDCRST_MAG66-1079 [uncultured Pseudonocardia sp.]|uniref:Uncharacterized protein n=1 Tax=uncultured Pseudonocardia sp. TaxID=211455 RepID=A0A6J4NUN3_9PSEU|nr:MAG: hypothetical protein AVDCRST_MAG66-1079 [uncultured Pseudonocardia sp.]
MYEQLERHFPGQYSRVIQDRLISSVDSPSQIGTFDINDLDDSDIEDWELAAVKHLQGHLSVRIFIGVVHGLHGYETCLRSVSIGLVFPTPPARDLPSLVQRLRQRP